MIDQSADYRIVKNPPNAYCNMIGAIVKFYSDPFDETGSAMAIFTILELPPDYDGDFFKEGSLIYLYSPEQIQLVYSPDSCDCGEILESDKHWNN